MEFTHFYEFRYSQDKSYVIHSKICSSFCNRPILHSHPSIPSSIWTLRDAFSHLFFLECFLPPNGAFWASSSSSSLPHREMLHGLFLPPPPRLLRRIFLLCGKQNVFSSSPPPLRASSKLCSPSPPRFMDSLLPPAQRAGDGRRGRFSARQWGEGGRQRKRCCGRKRRRRRRNVESDSPPPKKSQEQKTRYRTVTRQTVTQL